jgi:hypothetical protein
MLERSYAEGCGFDSYFVQLLDSCDLVVEHAETCTCGVVSSFEHPSVPVQFGTLRYGLGWKFEHVAGKSLDFGVCLWGRWLAFGALRAR